MPNGIENIVQAPPVQHIQVSEAPAHAQGLGQTHSVGKTVARIIGAIFSLGISEAVIAIVSKIRSASVAPAQPHLPGNIHPSPEAVTLVNQELANDLNISPSLMSDLRKERDAMVPSLIHNFGLTEFDTIENNDFRERLQQQILSAGDQIRREQLPELARNVTEAMMAEKFLEKIYEGHIPPTITKTWLQGVMRSDTFSNEIRALLHPEAGANLVDLREQARVEISTLADVRVSSRLAFDNLCAAGMAKFCSITGLSLEQAKAMNLSPLENKFSILFKELKEQGVNSVEGFMQAHAASVDKFFTRRAEAYATITIMKDSGELEPELASNWFAKCLEVNDEITSECFVAANAAAKAALQGLSLNILVSGGSVKERMALLDKILETQHRVRVTEYHEPDNLGISDKNMRTGLVIDAMLHRTDPDIVQRLASHSDHIEAFSRELNQDWSNKSEAMDDVADNIPDDASEDVAAAMRLEANNAMFNAYGRMEFFEFLILTATERQHN